METEWLHAPLKELSEYIVKKHHACTREQRKLIDDLMAKVEQRHGAEDVEVFQLGKAVAVFGSELRHHAECEETNLFPYISALEPVQKLRGSAQEQVGEGDVDDGFSGGMEKFVVVKGGAKVGHCGGVKVGQWMGMKLLGMRGERASGA